MLSMKFKDDEPLNTIKRIKEIFCDLNCTIQEEWESGVEGVYSVHLKIKGTLLSSNGKGITKELALASGYGELIERLQNMVAFRFTSAFRSQIKKDKGKVFPDEVICESIYTDDKMKLWFQEVINEENWELVNEYLLEYQDGKVESVPYRQYGTEKSILVPYILADIYYGSNGMAAGNTMEEAMVQGLCEIFERYVMRLVIDGAMSEDVLFPEITEYVITNFRWIGTRIEKIRAAGFDIHILDMNMGKQLPVIATILVKRETMEYYVDFGSHPILPIAVERTITECLQGRSLKNMVGMTCLMRDIQDTSAMMNLNNIFINGEGVYPYRFLCFSEGEPAECWNREYRDNRELLEACTKMIHTLGKNIYFRDMSFLGFPTYQIIVPGMSEIINDFKMVSHFFEFQKIIKEFKNIKSMKVDAAKKIVEFLDGQKDIYRMSLYDILQVPVSMEQPNVLLDITFDLLMMMLCAYISDFKKGAFYAKRYLRYLKSRNAAESIIKYYNVILIIFNMKKQGISQTRMKEVLISFIDEDYMNEVLRDVDSRNVLSNFPQITCVDCESCDVRKICSFSEEQVLYKELMQRAEKYCENGKIIETR